MKSEKRLAIQAAASGAVALGALAIGSIVIGVVVLRRLHVFEARLERVDLDHLHIGTVTVDAFLNSKDDSSVGNAGQSRLPITGRSQLNESPADP